MGKNKRERWLPRYDVAISFLYFPFGVAVDASGDIFIADTGDNRVRRVDAKSGIITAAAFNGQYNIIIAATGDPPSMPLWLSRYPWRSTPSIIFSSAADTISLSDWERELS